MSLLYRFAIPAGAALTAVLAAAAPATAAPTPPAPGVSIVDGAHVGFDVPGTNRSLMVDLTREGHQAALLDVEWSDFVCDVPTGPRTCVYTYREAYGVIASKAHFSLQRTSAVADIPYREGRRICVYTPVASGWGDTSECTDAPFTTGSARLDLTWTGRGESVRSEGVDAQGHRRISWDRGGHASGAAFGEEFPVEFSSVFKLWHTVTFS